MKKKAYVKLEKIRRVLKPDFMQDLSDDVEVCINIEGLV